MDYDFVDVTTITDNIEDQKKQKLGILNNKISKSIYIEYPISKQLNITNGINADESGKLEMITFIENKLNEQNLKKIEINNCVTENELNAVEV